MHAHTTRLARAQRPAKNSERRIPANPASAFPCLQGSRWQEGGDRCADCGITVSARRGQRSGT
jgi:hypothetical protein